MKLDRKTIIIILVGIFVVLPIMIAVIYLVATKQRQPTITTSVDPITGEQIIDGGTTPERAQSGTSSTDQGPVIYGSDNIISLYGDNSAYNALRRQFFSRVYKDDTAVKISPKNITKQSVNNPQTGEGYIAVTFYIYLNNDTVKNYKIETKYDENNGILTVNYTDKNKTSHSEQFNVFGGD